MIRNGFMPIQKPTVGAQLDRTHPASQGLQSAWLFNENTGNTGYDMAGTSHFAFGGAAAGAVARVASPYGPGIKFDGNATHANAGVGIAPGNPVSGATGLTILMRINQPVGGSGFGPLFSTDLNYNNSIYIGEDTASKLQSFIGSNVKQSVTFTAGVWTHIACVWNGVTNVQSCYVNGVLNATVAIGAFTMPTLAQTYIGRASATEGQDVTDANMDFLYAYNKALSPAEILANYRHPFAMFTPPNDRRFIISASIIIALAGAVSATSAQTGAVSVTCPLFGLTSSSSVLTGIANVRTPLLGLTAASAALVGNASVTIPVSTALASQGTLAGSASIAAALASGLTASSGFTPSVGVIDSLAGLLTLQSGLVGNLTVSPANSRPLVGTLAAQGDFTGSLNVVVPISVSMAGNSTLNGSMVVSAPMAALLAASGGQNATLTISSPLNTALVGALGANTVLAGNITVGGVAGPTFYFFTQGATTRSFPDN